MIDGDATSTAPPGGLHLLKPPEGAAVEGLLGTFLEGLPHAAWLARNLPVGTTLSEFPGFFAAASEIFFDGDENLLVFVYRGADGHPWLAWVSFDSEGMGVVHTAAIDL